MELKLFFRSIAAFVAIVLCVTIQSVEALTIPPDPFDATDRYALLILSPDGQTVPTVMVKTKSPAPEPLGPGQLGARIRYQLPVSSTQNTIKPFYEVISKPLPIEHLSSETPVTLTFDFSTEPLPAESHHRSLEIFYISSEPSAIPEPVAEFAPERLLLRSGGRGIEQTLSTAETATAGRIIAGPVTVLRERGPAVSETISFMASGSTDQYLLHLSNGEPSGSHRVSSVDVRLNGEAVSFPQQFNSTVAAFHLPLSVHPGANVLEIVPHGMPGTFLTATVAQLDSSICRAMGPRTIFVATGNPNTERLEFPLLPRLEGPYTLHIVNGNTDGTQRMKTWTVSLNNLVLLDLNDVQADVSEVSKIVDLLPSNILTVSFSGALKDRLTVEILGRGMIPPLFTATSPTDIIDTATIALQGTVDNPSAIVTVNGRPATVTSGGVWTTDHLELQQGENLLNIIAVDSCGNSQEKQITVFRR